MLCALSFTSLAMGQTLETAHFMITINCQSHEYEVGCSQATYQGANKKTGLTIHLNGKQIMQLCADGITPCHSLGYEFFQGNTRYFVSEGGQLLVTQGTRVLVDERGVWKE